jgi:hypothetical protein
MDKIEERDAVHKRRGDKDTVHRRERKRQIGREKMRS